MDSLTFYEQVYQVVRLIPPGRVTSYGAIASYLGTKGSSRMVGYAMNGVSKYDPTIPAQRVVNRSGLLTGKFHFQPSERMQQLLETEGVMVKDDQITNFKSVFWDPSVELDLEK